MQSKGLRVLITLVIAAGGVAFLFYSSISEAEYYKHVDELLTAPEKWESRTLRVHGFVKAGSLKESIAGQKTTRTFMLEYGGREIQVAHHGPKPDNFRDLAEVVAKGAITKKGDAYLLEASELSAKCPSKYEGVERTKDYGKRTTKPAAAMSSSPSQSPAAASR